MRVVDLSADFRLRDRGGLRGTGTAATARPSSSARRSTGCPSSTARRSSGAELVANPGCYPTAALLGLAPLARAGVIGDVVIDAKSGVSGAGREPSRTTHFIAADENMTPYKVDGHRHTPEIEQELAVLGRRAAGHLHAAPRAAGAGRARLLLRHARARRSSDAELADLYREAYEDEPWVELALGPPGVLEVRDTNYCRISVHVDGRTGRVLVFAAIDNLWKGAASQAVQNLNLMFERDESEGLR